MDSFMRTLAFFFLHVARSFHAMSHVARPAEANPLTGWEVLNRSRIY